MPSAPLLELGNFLEGEIAVLNASQAVRSDKAWAVSFSPFCFLSFSRDRQKGSAVSRETRLKMVVNHLDHLHFGGPKRSNQWLINNSSLARGTSLPCGTGIFPIAGMRTELQEGLVGGSHSALE